MAETTPRGPALREWLRALLGPVGLLVCAAWQQVRVTGPVTVALTSPAPPVALVAADVLAVLALTSMTLYAASALTGSRPLVIRFVLPAAASQLPMALVAILVGKNVLGGTVAHALKGHEKQLLEHPATLLLSLGLPALAVLTLTALAVTILLRGYSRATQARGARLILGFAGGLLAAEAICRIWSRFAG